MQRIELSGVGIDSLNIDDTATGERPVHSRLLGPCPVRSYVVV